MERVSCHLCGSSASRALLCARDQLHGGRFGLVRCPGCGLIFTNPRPSPEEMPRHYPQDLYGADPSVVEKREILNTFAQRGSVLDVGCGRGFFLRAIKDRFQVTGTDIDKASLAYAEKEFGIRVAPGELTAADLQPSSYDVVTYWHSLEHVHRPKESLQRAWALLRKGGILIVAVPNVDSLQAKTFGRNWYHLDVPRHLYHFNPKTLSRILSESGFSLIDTSKTLFSHNFEGWWRSCFNACHLPHSFPDKKRIEKALDPRWYLSKILLGFLLGPAYLLAKLEAGRPAPGIMVLVAKK